MPPQGNGNHEAHERSCVRFVLRPGLGCPRWKSGGCACPRCFLSAPLGHGSGSHGGEEAEASDRRGPTRGKG